MYLCLEVRENNLFAQWIIYLNNSSSNITGLTKHLREVHRTMCSLGLTWNSH